jgi:hypothetical protein
MANAVTFTFETSATGSATGSADAIFETILAIFPFIADTIIAALRDTPVINLIAMLIILARGTRTDAITGVLIARFAAVAEITIIRASNRCARLTVTIDTCFHAIAGIPVITVSI